MINVRTSNKIINYQPLSSIELNRIDYTEREFIQKIDSNWLLTMINVIWMKQKI